jgi:acyl carrier protein
VLAITGVPNARVPAQAIALGRPGNQPRGTVGDLRKSAVETGIDPEELWQLGESQSYATAMRWTPGADDGRFDVVFRRPEQPPVLFPEEAEQRPWRAYTNQPLRGKAMQGLAVELRGYLKDRLPEYMVPSAFVLLDALPQTPNGKIDRKALPRPDQTRPDGAAPFLAPRTPTEDSLARIWAEVLGVDRVGVHDNFFDLGGHSLQAVQLIARATKALGRDIPVKALFLYPTVATLAEAVDTGAAAPETQARSDCALRRAEGGESAGEAPHRRADAAPLAGEHLTIERRRMLPLFESGELAPVQAAAIGYLPSALLEYTGLSASEVIDGWCGGAPVVSGVYETALGRIGLLSVPRFDSQLYADPADLLGVLGEAMHTAGRLGAQVVSLTGLLPSATRYGRALEEALAGNQVPRITTGHATTTATIVLAIRRILAESGRKLGRERVGFVGLGSVGTATLRTLLSCLEHPTEIRLCDVYSKRDALLALRREIVEDQGNRGAVQLLEARGAVPPELYESTLIVGATNVPDILDVDRLRPGTLVVDDSAPHCFRVDRALRRLRERNDVLFTEGGMLCAPSPLERMLYVPADLEKVMPTLPAELFANYDPRHITGCVLSSLLSARDEALPPSLGLVGPTTCLDHYRALERLGFEAADLHCENNGLEEDAIERFRHRFGCAGDTEEARG